MQENFIVRTNTLKEAKASTKKILGNRIRFVGNKVYKLYTKVSIYTGLIIVCRDSNTYDLTYEVNK